MSAVERCPGRGCRWSDKTDHDRMLTMFEDGTVLANVICEIPCIGDSRNGDTVGVFEIDDFIAEHNWPDPALAAALRATLRDTIVALRPRR